MQQIKKWGLQWVARAAMTGQLWKSPCSVRIGVRWGADKEAGATGQCYRKGWFECMRTQCNMEGCCLLALFLWLTKLPSIALACWPRLGTTHSGPGPPTLISIDC